MASKISSPANGLGVSVQEMLTPKQYAALVKVSVSYLAKARQRGDGPPFLRFGRSIRYFPPKTP